MITNIEPFENIFDRQKYIAAVFARNPRRAKDLETMYIGTFDDDALTDLAKHVPALTEGEKDICDLFVHLITHETLHLVLKRVEGNDACHALDGARKYDFYGVPTEF